MMSDTLEKLCSILTEQFGIPEIEIEPDSIVFDIVMNAADLDEFRFLIEEDFSIDLSMVVKECFDTNIETSQRNLKNLTLRQIAGGIDDWLNQLR